MRFKIDWASLIVGSKFTVFALFYFVFEGNFQVQAPGGAYIWRGDLTEGFFCYEFGGLIHGGAYFWILRYFYFLLFRFFFSWGGGGGVVESSRSGPKSECADIFHQSFPWLLRHTDEPQGGRNSCL